MTKRIAILQSSYIPWKGYFDLINMVDEFILYDDVQYTKGDWRNRNMIKTKQGLHWLTIPVSNQSLGQKIQDTKVGDRKWVRKHWATIQQNYSKAACFKDYSDSIGDLYASVAGMSLLSEINFQFISHLNDLLGISTKIRWSREFELVNGRTERLIDLCKQCGATEYLSGPAAKDYFDLDLADQENIKVRWMDYSGYPEYNQLNPPFEHGVSILDLLFNAGPEARRYMKSFGAM